MMRRSSSSRPTNAVAGAPAGRSSDTTRYAATLSDRPFSEKTPTGVRVTSSRTRRCVDSPINTSPSCASCWSRAATLSGSPIPARCSSLTTTSPVLTATRRPRLPTTSLCSRANSRNCASGLPSAPHAGQRGASGLPQPPQNRAPAPCALPQLLQFITTPGWRTSSPPVLHPEATHAAELPDVVAHQHNPERKRMRRDLHVIRTDDRSAPFQGGADLAVDERGIGAEVDALHVGQEDVEPLVITPLVGALLRTESQLRDSNGADG